MFGAVRKNVKRVHAILSRPIIANGPSRNANAPSQSTDKATVELALYLESGDRFGGVQDSHVGLGRKDNLEALR
jgi:hypothetical protein